MHRVARLALVVHLGLLVACARAPGRALAPGAAAPISPPPIGSPPTPKPTDWKGLFDTDSQSSNVSPAPDVSAKVLRGEPACTRVETSASGAFTRAGQDETAFLLACGAIHRVLVRSANRAIAKLDVPEDTLEDAGDLDLDGAHELLLHVRGPKTSLRVLRFTSGGLATFYAFAPKHDPCAHTIVFYRLVAPNVEYRVDTLPKRCTP